MKEAQAVNESAASYDGKYLWRITATGLIWIGLIALALLLWKVASVLLLVFGGVLAAIFLLSLAEFVAGRLKVSRGTALSLVLVVLVAVTGLTIYLFGQPLVDQLTALWDEVPRALRKLREQVAETSWGGRLLDETPQSVDEIPIPKDDLAQGASNAVGALFAGLGGALVIGFVGIYLAFDPERYLNGAVRLASTRRRARLREVLSEVGTVLRWWLIGKIISMTVVGATTTLGLWLLGVPLAFALGVIAAILTFVPNFGPIVSAIPAVLLALLDSPMNALYVTLLYVGIQTVESYLITPLVQQKTVSLPPVLTISAQIALGMLFGGLGVIVATPLTAAVVVFIKRLYIDDVLEKRRDPEIATSG